MNYEHILKKKRKGKKVINIVKGNRHRLTSEVLLNIVLVQIDVKSSRLSCSRFYHGKKEEENELSQIVVCNSIQAQ